MQAKEDRRVGRTRKLLEDALHDLIVEKGYEAVTVQDIIDRANVGRSTFYAHYTDKQQLLFSHFADLEAHLAGPGRAGIRLQLGDVPTRPGVPTAMGRGGWQADRRRHCEEDSTDPREDRGPRDRISRAARHVDGGPARGDHPQCRQLAARTAHVVVGRGKPILG